MQLSSIVSVSNRNFTNINDELLEGIETYNSNAIQIMLLDYINDINHKYMCIIIYLYMCVNPLQY